MDKNGGFWGQNRGMSGEMLKGARESKGSQGRKEGWGGRKGKVERLHAKLRLNMFIVSASSDQKPQFLANFNIWGIPVLTPFYR